MKFIIARLMSDLSDGYICLNDNCTMKDLFLCHNPLLVFGERMAGSLFHAGKQKFFAAFLANIFSFTNWFDRE